MIDDDDWADLLARMGDSLPAPPGQKPVAKDAGKGAVVDDRQAAVDPAPTFIHNCFCGQPGPFGYGVNLRKDSNGKWFCREHRPV